MYAEGVRCVQFPKLSEFSAFGASFRTILRKTEKPKLYIQPKLFNKFTE